MKVGEANEKAMREDKRYGAGFFAMSLNNQAELIGCHRQTWKKTPFYQAAVANGNICPAKPKGPKVESLTVRREAVTGEGEKDEIQKQVAEKELRRLTAEQATDYEPTPLEDDPPGRKRKVHFGKRL
jgi:hypothetical protein